MTTVIHRTAAQRHDHLLRWLPVVAPGLAMLVVGMIAPTRPVLSWDEVATADMAHRSVGQIWRAIQHIDGVFGPYYLLMHAWTKVFGDSVLSLRLPSILAMAAAVALTGELARRLFGPMTGLLAGGLICLIPNISRYAAEARPYALACMFSMFALLALYRRAWVGYAAAIAALGLCSLVALAALAGHAAIVLIRARADLWRWCVAAAGPVVLLGPLIWWGVHQRSTQLYWVPPMTIHEVYAFPARLFGTSQVAWLLIGLLATALMRPPRPVVELAAAAGVPLLLICVAAFAGTSFWVNRYLLYLLLPAMIVVAAGLRRFGVAGLTAVAVVAFAAAPGQAAVRGRTVKNGSDYRTLAAIIEHRQQPGDGIVFDRERTMREGLGYYLRHHSGTPRDLLLSRSAAQEAGLRASEYPDPAARLAGADRIWLVVYGKVPDPATSRSDLRDVLQTQFRRVDLWTVKRGTMALYVRTTP